MIQFRRVWDLPSAPLPLQFSPQLPFSSNQLNNKWPLRSCGRCWNKGSVVQMWVLPEALWKNTWKASCLTKFLPFHRGKSPCVVARSGDGRSERCGTWGLCPFLACDGGQGHLCVSTQEAFYMMRGGGHRGRCAVVSGGPWSRCSPGGRAPLPLAQHTCPASDQLLLHWNGVSEARSDVLTLHSCTVPLTPCALAVSQLNALFQPHNR